MIVPYEFIYRNNIQALGDFHSQFFIDAMSDGTLVSVQFKAEGVTDFTDDWYFGLKINGADVLSGASRPHITSGDLEPLVTGLSIAVNYLDRISPTVNARATGLINGPITVIVFIDDGVGGSDVAASIHAATTQNPPVDADEFGFWGSGPALLRKCTWANIKTALTTLFDARYATPTDVSAAVAGLSWKNKVRAATTANGTLSTAFANGQVIDGVTLVTGDRILVKDQSTGSQNGIYVVAASGAPARATDADSGAELVNASCYVSEGTINADKQFVCTTNAPITVGTTVITFTVFSSGGGGGSSDFDTIITTPAGDELIFDSGNIVWAG